MIDRIMFSGLLMASFILAGCCGMFEEGGECVGETVVTINNQTMVCMDERMTSSCATEGQVYKQDSEEKVVCRSGGWAIENVTLSTSADNDTQVVTIGTGEDCLGTGFYTANDVTEACVDGKWTSSCSDEGEVYDESEFLEVQIVCENGRWVSKPFN